MKKAFRKSLSFLVAALLVTQAFIMSASASDTNILKARYKGLQAELLTDYVIDTVNPGAAGGNWSAPGGAWSGMSSGYENPPEGTITFSSTKSDVDYLNYLLKIDSTVVEFDRANPSYDYAGRAANATYTLTQDKYIPLKDGTGVLMYVKMPSNCKELQVYIIPAASNSWSFTVKADGTFYTLGKDATSWTSGISWGTGYIDIPTAGFEGYIYIPKASLEDGVTDWTTDSISKMQIAFGRFGGDDGAAYFSAPMVALSDPLAMTSFDKIILDGETIERDLFKAPEAAPEEKDDYLHIRPSVMPYEIEIPTTISVIQPGAEGGTDAYYGNPAVWSGLYPTYDNYCGGTVTFSTSIGHTPFMPTSFKLDSTVLEYDRVTGYEDYSRRGIVIDFNLPADNYISLAGGTGLLMYVKMPSNSKQFAPYFIPSNSGSWDFKMKSGLSYYTLAEGDTEWTALSGQDGEIIHLPYNGFEGYLWIPKTTLSSGESTDWETDAIRKFQIQFGNYGGEYGAAYFSAPMVTLNNPLDVTNMTLAYTTDESNPVDIFSGYAFEKGDANEDLSVDVKDFIAVKKMIAGISEKTKTADINGDGLYNADDLVILMELLFA